MAEKFLILGASSFYGKNFIRLLQEKGDELVAAFNHYGGLPDEDFDYVVNFASKSLVVESWRAPEEWADANVSELSLLVSAWLGEDFKKFIHVSTPEVYGSTHGWVDETFSNWQPTTPYAVTRAAGDMMLKAYHKAHGFPMLITRTANIYGPGQQPYRLIPKALECKRTGEAFPLHGGGQSVRSFIHVRDACEATYLLAKKGVVGETYHISTNQAHSIEDVIAMIECPFTWAPDRLGKDQAYLLNSDKLRAMGWKDTISLEEGLKECEQSISA
jgi:dTDP-glucose 4,6-dehydratase